jgi:hypothetical protein
LLALPGGQDLHELHVWGMASSQTALTAHLVLEAQYDDPDALLRAATHTLQERFTPARHAAARVSGLPQRRTLLMPDSRAYFPTSRFTRLRHPEVPHHPHVLVLEDMAVVQVQPGMTGEWHVHANRFSGEHEHRIPPPAVHDACA